jgi:hypothetical protein
LGRVGLVAGCGEILGIFDLLDQHFEGFGRVLGGAELAIVFLHCHGCEFAIRGVQMVENL